MSDFSHPHDLEEKLADSTISLWEQKKNTEVRGSAVGADRI